tara:strand:- start:13326 stop:14081 length:756 start_codon:yes stop_codon:yes gene_type:complete
MVRHIYKCEYCNFESSGLSNYKIHLETKKHLKRKHEHSCRLINSNPNAYLEELVDTMKKQMYSMNAELQEHKKLIDDQAKQIAELENRSIGGGNITNNGHIESLTNINISMTPFSRSKLPDNLNVVEILKGVNTCWAELLSKKFFNPDIPEQNNLRIINQQKKTSKTYDGQQWNVTNTQHLIKTMIDDLSTELETRGEFEKFRENASEFIKKRFAERYSNSDDIVLKNKDIKNIEQALLSQQKKLRLSTRV